MRVRHDTRITQAAFELSCYDEIKMQLKKTGLIKEGEMSGVFLVSSVP